MGVVGTFLLTLLLDAITTFITTWFKNWLASHLTPAASRSGDQTYPTAAEFAAMRPALLKSLQWKFWLGTSRFSQAATIHDKAMSRYVVPSDSTRSLSEDGAVVSKAFASGDFTELVAFLLKP